DGHARQVDALVVRDRSGHLDDGDHVGVGDLGDAHGDLAVVDEQHVTRAAVPRQALEGGGDALAGALDVLGGDGEGLADLELVRTVGEPAQADLRALEVDQDGDVLPEVLGGPADVRVHLRVIV